MVISPLLLTEVSNIQVMLPRLLPQEPMLLWSLFARDRGEPGEMEIYQGRSYKVSGVWAPFRYERRQQRPLFSRGRAEAAPGDSREDFLTRGLYRRLFSSLSGDLKAGGDGLLWREQYSGIKRPKHALLKLPEKVFNRKPTPQCPGSPKKIPTIQCAGQRLLGGGTASG